MSEIRRRSPRPRVAAQPAAAAPSLRYRRVVVKAGTNVLTGGTERLNPGVMAALVAQLVELHQRGAEVILVTSGAVAAGRQVLGLVQEERRDIPSRQVQAAVGQSRLMRVYEELFDAQGVVVAQTLVSRDDLSDRMGYLNVRNTLLTLLDLRVVPVVNENDVVAVEELVGEVFGDNDTLSAMIANLVDADLLVMLTDTQGLYTADPDQNPQATLVRRVERVDAAVEELAGERRESKGRGGMATKLQAAKLATSSGVTVVIADGRQTDTLLRVAEGEEVGTLFVPTAAKMESRKRWMLSGLSTRGEILVDAGAAAALRVNSRSLLPAGVRGVRGSFQRGDIVSVVEQEGERVACGIANYAAEEIDAIKGLRSDRIEATLGYQYGQEVVHRNNLVLLDQG